MLSVFDQENLTSTHATNAANKPLNQGVRALQPKTPGPTTKKTPSLARNDENASLATSKAGKNAFITPAPRTNRAPLGAKTTNAKAQPFQTPAAKPFGKDNNVQKSSATRRTAKKKIFVQPEPVNEPEIVPAEEEEPDFGFAPPDAIPLPDPPLDFSEIDQSYPELAPKEINKALRQYYFQSPKDENGFSISLKKQEQEAKTSLERDLAHILLDNNSPRTQVQDEHTKVATQAFTKPSTVLPQPARVDTIRARSAASTLSHISQPRTHQRLPSAATRETASSKQKRLARTAFPSEENVRSIPAPIYKSTIGFPKARKPASILPSAKQSTTSHMHDPSKGFLLSTKNVDKQAVPDNAIISPRKFVQLYGEPDVESDMWARLKELEVRDRRREDTGSKASEDNIFDFEIDNDLDDRLAAQSGIHDEFELNFEDL